MSAQRFSAKIQRVVRGFSALARLLPTDNNLLRRFLLLGSGALDEYSFDFDFWCPRLGIRWSAAAFPEPLTRHMMFDGVYQHDVLYWIRTLSRRGGTVFDVGAFHGLMSVVASRAVGPAGKVVAFEPNEQSHQHLARHLALNRCRNVVVERIGVMNVEQNLEFYPRRDGPSWNSSFVREFVDPHRAIEPISVPCTTLDRYVQRTGLIPQLIKIDTEGTEFTVLQGARQTIEQHRPALIMEFNQRSAQKAGTSIPEVLDWLTRHGYAARVIPAKRYGGFLLGRDVAYTDTVPTAEGLANVACLPQKKVAIAAADSLPTS
jgi:FkbM family methyltransferase